MVQVYIDDSGSGLPPVSVLAGLVSTEDRWREFTVEWRTKLAEAPSISYFKMKYAMGRQGVFIRMTNAQRDQKVSDLVDIINKHVEYIVVSSVEVEPYRRVYKNFVAYTLESDSYFIMADLMLKTFFTEVRKNWPDPIDFIFDQQGGKAHLETLAHWQMLGKTLHPALRVLMGEAPRWVDEKDVPPVQAADLVASMVRRTVADRRAHPGTRVTSPAGLVAQRCFERLRVPMRGEHWTEAKLLAFREGSKMIGIERHGYEDAWERSRRHRLLGLVPKAEEG